MHFSNISQMQDLDPSRHPLFMLLEEMYLKQSRIGYHLLYFLKVRWVFAPYGGLGAAHFRFGEQKLGSYCTLLTTEQCPQHDTAAQRMVTCVICQTVTVHLLVAVMHSTRTRWQCTRTFASTWTRTWRCVWWQICSCARGMTCDSSHTSYQMSIHRLVSTNMGDIWFLTTTFNAMHFAVHWLQGIMHHWGVRVDSTCICPGVNVYLGTRG